MQLLTKWLFPGLDPMQRCSHTAHLIQNESLVLSSRSSLPGCQLVGAGRRNGPAQQDEVVKIMRFSYQNLPRTFTTWAPSVL